MVGEPLKGHLEVLLLAVVSASPLHGYGVVEELRQRSGGQFELPEGTVYPALHRLERDGLLRSTWTVVDGRRRRQYSLTARGRRALGVRSNQWREFAGAVERVLGGGASRGAGGAAA
jgi:DNA-binding PadR family transcriptional regulator